MRNRDTSFKSWWTFLQIFLFAIKVGEIVDWPWGVVLIPLWTSLVVLGVYSIANVSERVKNYF